MIRPIHGAAGIAIFLAATCHPALAEIFVLKSGGRIEGEPLNPQRAAGQPYQLRTEDGLRLALAENTVARVIVKSDVEQEYEARLPGVANTVEGHWKMAEWCQEAGLTDERRRHLTAIIAIDPNHAEARRLLGYTLYGSTWLTQNEFLLSRGYVHHKGAWRLSQEIELEDRNRKREQAVKDLRQFIRTWLEQAGTSSRHAANAERSLNEIRDPSAAPALVEILGDARQPRAARLRCLEILGRLPPGLATATLIKVAMEDRDDTIRDRSLDELIRGGVHLAGPGFLNELKVEKNSKNYKIEYNWRVNRAAYCLARLGYTDATLPLINALTTEHQELVPQGGSSGGGGGTPLSFGSGGPGGGMGSFGVGGRPKVRVTKRDNSGVRDALAQLHAGVNHQYDAAAWKRWYIQKFTTTNVDLRRGE
jgi:hypothetical protein